MPCLKGTELCSVPLTFTAAKVNPLADNRVAQLMVKNRCNPPTGRWLEELLGDHNSAPPDVTGREYPLLRTGAPCHDIRI